MRNINLLLPGLLSLVVASSVCTGASSQTAPASTAMGDLCTGGTASGTGLRGAYYTADPRNSRPALVRLDATVSSATLTKLSGPFASRVPRVVRWCGWIRPIASGPHRFGAEAPSLRVEISRQVVAGPGVDREVVLEAGKPYAILVELAEMPVSREFALQWTPPFGVTYDIPQTVLFPPVDTTNDGC